MRSASLLGTMLVMTVGCGAQTPMEPFNQNREDGTVSSQYALVVPTSRGKRLPRSRTGNLEPWLILPDTDESASYYFSNNCGFGALLADVYTLDASESSEEAEKLFFSLGEWCKPQKYTPNRRYLARLEVWNGHLFLDEIYNVFGNGPESFVSPWPIANRYRDLDLTTASRQCVDGDQMDAIERKYLIYISHEALYRH